MSPQVTQLAFKLKKGRKGTTLAIEKIFGGIFVSFCRAIQRFLLKEATEQNAQFLNDCFVRIEQALGKNKKRIGWDHEISPNTYIVIKLVSDGRGSIAMPPEQLERLVNFLKAENFLRE